MSNAITTGSEVRLVPGFWSTADCMSDAGLAHYFSADGKVGRVVADYPSVEAMLVACKSGRGPMSPAEHARFACGLLEVRWPDGSHHVYARNALLGVA